MGLSDLLVRFSTMMVVVFAILVYFKPALINISIQSIRIRSKLPPPVNPEDCPVCWQNTTDESYRFPAYMIKPQFLSPAECEWLIATVNQRYMGSEGQVGGRGPNGTVKVERRKATGTSVAKQDDAFNWVLNRTLAFVRRQNAMYWQYKIPSNYSSELIEDMHFVMYDGSLKGFYDWHSDTAVAGPRSLRKISAVAILSSRANYTGGEFMLKPEHKEIKVAPEQGSLILFPSFVLHKVDPVTSGLRHSLVMQIGGYN